MARNIYETCNNDFFLEILNVIMPSIKSTNKSWQGGSWLCGMFKNLGLNLTSFTLSNL